jgi:putative membrane-bound dehydrogenase-like protein
MDLRFIRWLVVGLAMIVVPGSNVDGQDFVPANTQADGEGPLPPAQAIKRLRVADGFRITLAAAEPDVRQPIAITFDDRGRLWVAESYSYDGSTFTDEQQDRILIFEDTTGDGVLDRRKVFCDGLTHLTGLEIGFGGVWITAPPHLSFIPDRNQDDVPDGDVVKHLDGWSLKAEHNSVNGLTWGPDGWMYGRHGIKQTSRVGRPGDTPESRVELSCSIWRYHPTRHEFEVVADGTINPWGLDFDDHGQGFLTTSVVEHLWHLVPGAHYERWKDRGVHFDPYVYEAMSATSDHLHWAFGSWDKAGRMARGNQDHGGGHSHCDAMIYLGDRWPAAYRGTLLTSNIHGRRVNRDRLVRRNGVYRGEHADDFLVADDPWFRAVSMEYGPDGDIYLTDWSDNGECHDRDGVHRTSGRIYKVTWGDPRLVKVDLRMTSNEQLVKYQLHANDWYVRHARRILQERSIAGQSLTKAHAELRSLFDRLPDVTRKLRCLWALYVSGGADDAWLLSLLENRDEHVRSWAVRLLTDGQALSEGILNHLARMTEAEESWLVQMTLASAIRQVSVEQRWQLASKIASRVSSDSDANLQRMIWYAIEPGIPENPRRAVTLATQTSPKIRQWIARRLTEHSVDAVAIMFDELSRLKTSDVISDLLAGFNEGLATLEISKLPASVGDVASRLIDHSDAEVRVEAVTAVAAIGDEANVAQIRKLLHDRREKSVTRLAALSGLSRRNAVGLSDDLHRLIEAGQLTSAVLGVAASIKDPAFAMKMVSRYESFTESDRNSVIEFLAARKTSAQLLVSAIEKKEIAAADVTAAQARQISSLGDAVLEKRLNKVWGTLRKSPADRLRLINERKKMLFPTRLEEANLANGREVFRKTCSSCHKLFDVGRTIGPELTGANRRNLHYLISNVVDPSAAVPVDFRLTTVVTTNGRVITGAISQRSDAGLTIQTSTESVRVGSDDVALVKVSKQSMMPDGLLDKLTDNQTRDLFAWMMSDGEVSETDQGNNPGTLPVVILLGDSIRMNYQQTVVTELTGKATVLAPKENCRHTKFVLENLEKWIKGRNASLVHINVGLHDMFLSSATGQPRHSLEVYEANLRSIFVKLKELTDAKIVFALTTPVIEARQAVSEGYKRVVRREADVVMYNARAGQIAHESGIQVNDVHGLSSRVGTNDVLRESDGIHLSKVGEEVIGKHVASVIADVLSGATLTVGKSEEGFTAIFNGADLAGWDGKPGAWDVHDGEIWCTGKAEQKNWLIWRGQQPSDFVLRLEFRWDKGNSGVQVRSDDLGNWMLHGYQVEVAKQSVMGLWHHSLLDDDHPRKQARHLMATAGQQVVLASDGSKIVDQVENAESLKQRFSDHAWNTMEIVAEGDTLTQKINGVVFSQVTDQDKKMRRRKGFIALQDHGKDCKVAFRNIRLKVATRTSP